jgi:hypothetical protein
MTLAKESPRTMSRRFQRVKLSDRDGALSFWSRDLAQSKVAKDCGGARVPARSVGGRRPGSIAERSGSAQLGHASAGSE